MSSIRLFRQTVRTLCAQDLSKFPNPGPWDMHSFVGRERDQKSTAVGTSFSGQIPSMRCSEILCAPDLSNGLQTLGDGTCIASLAGATLKNAELLARVFQDKFHQYNLSRNPKNCAPKTCQMVSKRRAECFFPFGTTFCSPFAAKQAKREPKHRSCVSVNGQVGK